jgi:hypothetical protein
LSSASVKVQAKLSSVTSFLLNLSGFRPAHENAFISVHHVVWSSYCYA